MNNKIICGIQQIGVGVKNIEEAWKWYYKAFGLDIKAFDDENIADIMAPYMGGKPRAKHAVLAVNMQGGGGFEIWQHTDHTPIKPNFELQLGDLGLFAAKIKCKSAVKTYEYYEKNGIKTLGGIAQDPRGKETIFIKDPFGNIFQLVENDEWYLDEKKPTGGTFGAIIGVSDIENAKKVYSDVLGYNKILFEKEGNFEDLKGIPGENNQFKRVLLTHDNTRTGSFSKLYGPSEIELVQVLDREPKKIFENRYWGDPGFIHLCFDIIGMNLLKEECAAKGFPFKVNSEIKHVENGSFDMGDASGHFSYIEDPDGTLIEFVETHKVPIIKSLGLFINLRKREPGKNLPNWMIKSLKMKRVKF